MRRALRQVKVKAYQDMPDYRPDLRGQVTFSRPLLGFFLSSQIGPRDYELSNRLYVFLV